MATKKIILKSSDGQFFEVDETVAMKAVTIIHMIEVDCANEAIPLANIAGAILAGIIEYCKKHVEAAVDPKKLKKWDAEFVDKFDLVTIIDMGEAADFLNISELIDLTLETFVDRCVKMSSKTTQEKLAFLNGKNDYTAEEEKEFVNFFGRRKQGRTGYFGI